MTHLRTFRLQDLLGYKILSLPTCTSDGRLAAFVVTQPDEKSNKNVSELWAWEEGRGAWQVTFGGWAGQPAFGPRGQRLAFLSNRGCKKHQLFVMGQLLSEGRKITDMDEGVTGFCWSPDGRKLAFLALANRTPKEKKLREEKRDGWIADRDERGRRLWVVSAKGGKPVPVSTAAEHVNAMAWTPDGKRLVYSASPRAVTDSQWYESNLKIVRADGRGRRVVGPHRSHNVAGCISVSPDGRRVLITEWHDETDQWHDTAKVVDLATGRRRRVAKNFDLQSVSPQWVGEEVCFEAGEGTSYGLWLCAVGGRPRKLLTGPGSARQSVAAAGANRIFYIYSEAGRAEELHARSLDGQGKPHPLTRLNRHVAGIRLAETRIERWRNGSLEIEGLLYLPTSPGARKPYPLIVMPHGGPHWAASNDFSGAVVANLFCAAGYACLRPNFRGSTGYGRLFARKIIGDWGKGPFGDIQVGVDALVRRRLADGRRLAIFGGSYGGYMTCWTIGHTNRYRCAVAVAAVTNNLTEWASNDIPSSFLYSAGGTLPSFTGRFWRDQSPVHHVAKVKTPTLIITGQADVRVPPGQSWHFYRALKLRGVPTQLLLYPREGHDVVAEPRHRLHYFRQILNYVNEHMKR